MKYNNQFVYHRKFHVMTQDSRHIMQDIGNIFIA